MLVRPDNVTYKDGQIDRIFCQVCGVEIAGMVERPKGSGPDAAKLVMAFKRFHNYAEVKFRHSDGNFHVTNGCWNCIKNLKMDVAQEIYEADMTVMGMKADKQVVEIVAVDTSGSGLV